MNSIEEKLWNYIDGTCTNEEYEAITLLIEQDEVYKNKYHELLQLNLEIAAMEPDEPSMSFTYKVMESIRTEQAAQPLKASINPRIIIFISAFFLLTIAGILIFMLSTIHLSSTGNNQIASFKVDLPQINNLFNTVTVKTFLILEIIVGLFLFDAWLRKKNVAKAV
jgi:hypothetical protein